MVEKIGRASSHVPPSVTASEVESSLSTASSDHGHSDDECQLPPSGHPAQSTFNAALHRLKIAPDLIFGKNSAQTMLSAAQQTHLHRYQLQQIDALLGHLNWEKIGLSNHEKTEFKRQLVTLRKKIQSEPPIAKTMPLNQSQFKKFEKQLIGILAQRLPNPTGQTLSYRVKKTAAFLGVAENPKSKKAKKLVKQTGVCYRNDQKWETIKTQFEHFSPQGEKKTYTVVHNPAGQLMLGAHDIFPVDYKGKGICSGTTDCIEHATNLYTAELTDEHNQSLLKVVRHGICSPYGIKHDPELREQGALNRAREVVSAALFLQLGPEALQRALEQNQVIELNAFSNSLVTPADFFKDTEGTQLMDQMKAFDRLKHAPDKEPIKLTLTDRDGNLRTVQLRLTMPTFNWGVNPAALKLNLAGVDLTGSWEVADAYNKLGMIDVFGEKTVEQFSPTVIDTVRTNISQLTKKSNEPEPVEPLELDGMVGRYLNKKPAPDNTALVTQLSEQILQIWQKKLYRVDKGDPYKMAARMILLGSEIDGISCINCKSGKDRTGKAYEEAARLKIWVSLGKGLPPIDYEFTHEEKKLLDTIAANSGNAEIQIQNTGLPGNKVLNPSLLGSSNADRFPDRQKAVHAATLSGLVSS